MFDNSETEEAFDGYWVAIEDETPVLRTFVKKNK
jgi:hypothetical protein